MKGIEGSTLGRYELQRRIANGGMSEVYLGYDRRVQRRVAVKVFYGSDESFVRRFEHEAVAVGTLSHDHILPLYDFGEQRSWYYLVMPFVEGGTLRDYLVKRERLTLAETESLLDQIASALQHAHDHGVVHRDVKPSNILLRPDGHAYLADFGLAKAKMEADSPLTHIGAMIGTPEYMAPEQSNGQNDYRSDTYSLGIILYQMLAGRVPFTAESPMAISLKHIQVPPTPPRQFNPDIPQAVEEVMLKALAKDPDDRYQQAHLLSIAYRKAFHQTRSHSARQQSEASTPTVEDAQERQIEASERSDSSELPIPATMTKIPSLYEADHSEIDTTPPLFPLGIDIPSFSSLPERPQRRWSLSTALLVFLCLILLGSTIVAVDNAWHAHNPSQNASPHATATAMAQGWKTATVQANLQATLAAQAQAQAAAGITTAIGAGKVLYHADMTSAGGGWINDGSQCYFSAQGYHVSTPLKHAVAWCYSNQQSYSDAIITVQAQLLRGDIYGLVFRLTPNRRAFYVLELNSQGEYRLVRALGNDPLQWLTLIDWTRSNAILSGYGSTNTFLVIATGNHFRFYMNKQLIVSTFTDHDYTSGFIGVLVGGDSSGGTEAVFRNLWIFQKQPSN